MLEAINDHITNMCMDLQGSTMTEFHRRDPKEDYSWILDMISGPFDPTNEESHKGDDDDDDDDNAS